MITIHLHDRRYWMKPWKRLVVHEYAILRWEILTHQDGHAHR